MFTEENIVLNLDIEEKGEVLEYIANMAATLNITTDSKKLLEALNQRELETCTGMVNGIAIPHARSKYVDRASLIFIKVKNPIKWESLDGQPVNLIFGLLAPDIDGDMSHLQMLSNIATGLIEESNIKKLGNAETKEEVIQVINSFLN